MPLKVCTKCNESHDVLFFNKQSQSSDGLYPWCKACVKLYNLQNKQIKSKRNREWYIDNTVAAKQYSAVKYREHIDYYKNYAKQYKKLHREERNERDRVRYRTDMNYRLSKRLRTRLHDAVLRGQKAGSAIKDLGCTIGELKSHLESLFQPGMTWDNYGEWHIDHIIPLSSFDLTDRSQLLKACNYINLQPLWASDNISKSNRS